jgi:nucleotide-binding universal stress UspA family protein
MFDRILVPVDGSDHSMKALDCAVQIAKKFSGKITLLHVYSASVEPVFLPEPTALGAPSVPLLTSAEASKVVEAAKRAGKRILDDGEERVKAGKVVSEKILVEGHPVEEIVREAREHGFDLIVIGARGVSHFREILLGSVTDGVIHHVECPVLVVK